MKQFECKIIYMRACACAFGILVLFEWCNLNFFFWNRWRKSGIFFLKSFILKIRAVKKKNKKNKKKCIYIIYQSLLSLHFGNLVNTSKMLTETQLSFTNITELRNEAIRISWYSNMKNKFPILALILFCNLNHLIFSTI